jgi:hypothetical protein
MHWTWFTGKHVLIIIYLIFCLILVSRTRGDGFPLAAMLAAVSTEAKELIPILAAHIYTVCPTVIPKLPAPAKDSSETELMESLGMIKTKNGEFETFDRFLARTEVRNHILNTVHILHQ